jgi:tight adherence protein C
MMLALRILSLVGVGVALWTAVLLAADGDVRRESYLGLRGLKRRRAVDRGGSFAGIEPLLRASARWAALIPLGGARPRIAETLRHAGDWLGLEVDELVALSVLGGGAGLATGGAMLVGLELPGVVVPFLGGLGLALPWIAVTGEVQRRAKSIGRALPGAIDLAALCMTAGLSFPEAITQIVTKSGDADDPLNEELQLVLNQLRLGWTRSRALASFADRVPSQAVRSFVSAVVQSEERGSPLVEVLRIQATTLRQRRSASGEEAASRAAVLMLFPLMLILAAIILLLMGPFVLQGMASGL